MAWPEARLASTPDRCSACFSAQYTRTRLDFARGSSRFAQGPAQLVSAYHRFGIRLSAARLDSLFGARLISARGSGSAWD